MATFVEKNKDFVLKLKIKTGGDQTQIRRASLPRIADANGNISYEELVGLALVFTKPEEDPTTRNTKNYTITFTYYDDEKDLITLASTEELMDAIELFAGQKFIKITTCVKPKISSSTTPPSAAPYAHDTTASSPSRFDRGTSTNDEKHPIPPPIRVVLESFAGILSTAVNNLQEGIATQSPSSDTPDDNRQSSLPAAEDLHLKETSYKTSASKTSARANAKRKAAAAQRAKAAKERTAGKEVKNPWARKAAPYSANSACKNSGLAAANAIRQAAEERRLKAAKEAGEASVRKNNFEGYRKTATSCANSASQSNGLESKEKSPCGSSKKAKEPEQTDVEEPFIHGRHTCDGCLTTPIIGKRYHSTNLKDYDLCQKCFDNYKGSEIKFEFVELRRDIAFQKSWRHRRDIYMRYQSGRRSCGPYVPRRERNQGKSNSQRVSVASQGGPGFVVRGNNRTPSKENGDKSSCTHTASRHSNAFYANQDPNPTAPIEDNASSSNEFDDLLKEAIRRSLDDVVPKEASTAGTIEAVETKTNLTDEASELSEKKPLVEDNVPENDISDAKDDIPRSVDIMEDNTADIERLTFSDATYEHTNASFEANDEEAMEKAMDTDSVDSEKLVSESSDRVTLSPRSKQKELDDYFASDAVGNGDVAEAMGKTFDMVAGAITEMLNESEDLGKPNENDEVLDSESKDGEVIVNSNDDDAKADENDDDSNVDDSDDDADWSVVKSIGSSGTTESEQIGKAAEMLGSALFNSDMNNASEENVSSFFDSESSYSIPSSVPSDLGTVHSRVAGPSQLTRWAAELEKLRELGFDNEVSCIEILERIGSNSETIETNIDRVVDDLLLLKA